MTRTTIPHPEVRASASLEGYGRGAGLCTFFRGGDVHGIALAALGFYSSWRFYRAALNNLPRNYTPDRLPEFLLS
jgi:hypothetical protein